MRLSALSPLSELSRKLARPWWLALALGLLHLGLLQGVATPVGRGLMLGHLGAVLVWQPLVSGARRLSAYEMGLGAAAIVMAGWWLNLGMLLVWMLLLAGMLGGKLFLHAEARARLPYWLALAYLVLALCGIVLPDLLPLPDDVPAALYRLVAWLALPLLLGMVVLGARHTDARDAGAMDFVGSLVIMLVLAGVLLGALALMFVNGSSYLRAMVQSLAVMAGGLLMLGWAWNPRQGFGGLGLAVSRHLLSGSETFGRWLETVAQAASEATPAGLVERAAQELLRWPVRGVRWHVKTPADARGEAGTSAACWLTLSHGAVRIEVGTEKPLGPTPQWQLDLMVRVLAEFHRAAEQAQHLRATSYLRAVHETGARVTHEVKNLLQSLDTLCFALAATDGSREQEVAALVRRQLPVISERLHDALSRIRRPEQPLQQYMSAGEWWAQLQERHAGDRITFGPAPAHPAMEQVPRHLFDTVADNLLRNALEKRCANNGLSIVATLGGAAGVAFSIEDDGVAVPLETAQVLMHMPVESPAGFGIGLYQSAQLAASEGYRLQLEENRPGCVRFTLSRLTEPGPRQDVT